MNDFGAIMQSVFYYETEDIHRKYRLDGITIINA